MGLVSILETLIDVFLCYSIPSTYQYSALSQYDNDRDEEINDLEDHLDILIEDSSSSDNEEEAPSKDILDIDAVSFHYNSCGSYLFCLLCSSDK